MFNFGIWLERLTLYTGVFWLAKTTWFETHLWQAVKPGNKNDPTFHFLVTSNIGPVYLFVTTGRRFDISEVFSDSRKWFFYINNSNIWYQKMNKLFFLVFDVCLFCCCFFFKINFQNCFSNTTHLYMKKNLKVLSKCICMFDANISRYLWNKKNIFYLAPYKFA